MSSYWYAAYIGLGSNLDKPIDQLRNAFLALNNHPNIKLITRSSFYQTKPVGGVKQADFINAVAAVVTTLSAENLLKALLQIENQQGRERIERWGPRTLDLDLLVYSDQTSDNEFLKLPHPELSKRDFVLIPLAEISPDLRVPNIGRVNKILKIVDNKDIQKIEF